MEPHDLERFVVAHAQGGVAHGAPYDVALRELRAGRKESHWIWYVFPQALKGTSTNAGVYCLRSVDEAAAYVAHPLLWDRYVASVEALVRAMDVVRRREEEGSDDPLLWVMGSSLDARKTLSSLTLFAQLLRFDVSPRTERFRALVPVGRMWQGRYPLCQTTLRLPGWW